MPQHPGRQADGRRLRELRIERGIRVEALARQIGRTPQTIWNAERGIKISAVAASQIANGLTALSPPGKGPVQVQDFMPGDDDTAPQSSQAVA